MTDPDPLVHNAMAEVTWLRRRLDTVERERDEARARFSQHPPPPSQGGSIGFGAASPPWNGPTPFFPQGAVGPHAPGSERPSLPETRGGLRYGRADEETGLGAKRRRTMSQQMPPPSPPQAEPMNRSVTSGPGLAPWSGSFFGDEFVAPLGMHNGGGVWDLPSMPRLPESFQFFPEPFHPSSQFFPESFPQSFPQSLSPPFSPSFGALQDPATWVALHPAEADADMFGSCQPWHPSFFADMSQPNVAHVSNTSVCGSMTSAPTVGTDSMSRQTSSASGSQSLPGGVAMMPLGSSQSFYMPSMESSEMTRTATGSSPPKGKRCCPEDAVRAPDMSRSESNSSLKVRAREALEKQNQQSRRVVLQPKPPSGTAPQTRVGEVDAGKVAVATVRKYRRAEHAKVKCTQCNDRPEGFRGDHELRRHRLSKHQSIVKKWICVNPTEPICVPTITPLDQCKACLSVKSYGAYYNAAAHLRRTHFKAKPTRAKKRGIGAGKGLGDGPRRGGNGGGDEPSMTELRKWMREVTVPQGEASAIQGDEGEGEEDEDVDENDVELAPANNGLDFDLAFASSMGMPDSVPLDLDSYSNVEYDLLGIGNDEVAMHEQMTMPRSSTNFGHFFEPTSSSPFIAYQSQNAAQYLGSSGSDTVTPGAATPRTAMSSWSGAD